MKCFYIAVTDDAFELPCIVGTAQEVARFVGMTLGSFYCAITRHTCSHTGYKVYKVEDDERDKNT